MTTVSESASPPESQALTREGTSLETAAQDLVIRDPATFERAAEMLKTVKLFLRRVADVFDPLVEAAHHAHKVAVQQRDGFRRHALLAEQTIKTRMAVYEQEVERQRREAEAAARRERERLEREAREAAEAEQRRLQAEAEERRLAEAAAAEAAGDHVGADKLLEAPIAVPVVAPAPVFTPPVAVESAPKIEGLSFRDVWRAEVIDMMALVRAVAAGTAPVTLVAPNEAALNQMARALKGAMAVPGVRAVSSRTAAVRS